MDSEKQFDPSAKKIKKARENGDIAKCRELSGNCGAILGFLIIYMLLSEAYLIRSLFEHFLADQTHLSNEAMLELLKDALVLAVICCLPVALASFLAVFFMEALQVGLVWSIQSITPSLARLNPITGLKRMFGFDKNSGGFTKIVWEVCRGLVFAILILAITFYTVQQVLSSLIISATNFPAAQILLSTSYWQLTFFVLFACLSVCLIDLLYQRALRIKRLRMDIHEFKREIKDSDGSPEMKGMRKQLHQEVLLHGLLEDVRKAKVVIIGEEATE